MKSVSNVVVAISAIIILIPNVSKARNWIGWGQEGDPGSLAFQNYPTYAHQSSSSNTLSNDFELAYYSNTFLTGTTRDQLEVWASASGGYTNTHGAPGSSGFGISGPEVGLEYYYQIIQPTAPIGSPNYVDFWFGPWIDVNFPNGNTNTAGYGVGADQYSLDVVPIGYFQIGKIAITVSPLSAHYGFTDLNTTIDAMSGLRKRDRQGWSFTVGDGGIGYQITPTLIVGLLQQFNLNNIDDSTVRSSREGFIGPTFTYAGFSKRGLYISGAVQTDYYNEGLKHQNYVAAWISQEF